jgi:4-hydroxy-2-oxoheptanedioate aldolase
MASATVLRSKWAKGETAFGAFAALPCGFAAELLCVDGVDYIVIDQQHGLVDYQSSLDMLRAIEGRGRVALTRVPANQGWMIGKALDAGIQGVIVPMVSTAAEANEAVAACRYQPRGTRSFGPVRAQMLMNTRDVATLGNSVLCFVMVETRQGVENVDAIAATPGLDGIYVGPADLALGLGLQPNLDKEEPEHVAAVKKILDACKRHNIIAGIQCGNGKSAKKFSDQGFQFVTFTKDSSILPSAVEKEARAALGADTAAPQLQQKRGYA